MESLLSAISHELRTPTNIVVSGSGLLLDEELVAEHHDLVKSIHTAGQNLLTVVNNLQDLLALQMGSACLNVSEFSIEPALRLRLGELQGFHLSFDKRVPSVIRSDQSKLCQILYFLVQATATNSSTVDVRVSVTPDDLYLKFIVASNELITAQATCDVSHLITIAKSFLSIFKSRLRTVAVNGHGAFCFKIPLIKGTKQPDLPSRPLRILLVEDNSVNRMIAVKMLEKLGHTPDVACNGLEATLKVKARASPTGNRGYDIVLMVSPFKVPTFSDTGLINLYMQDCDMPVMDGFQATKIIKKEITFPPRIVALTADCTPACKERCIEAGMDEFRCKPVSFEIGRAHV